MCYGQSSSAIVHQARCAGRRFDWRVERWGEGEIVGARESVGAHMVSIRTLVYVSVLTGRIPFARGLGVEGGRGADV